MKPAVAASSRTVGATILHAVVRNGRLRWPVSEEIYRLSDVPVLSVRRRAKYLLLELPDGWIIVHLGMSGSLRILSEELPAEKHDHVDTVMSNGKVLRYTDPRRFGAGCGPERWKAIRYWPILARSRSATRSTPTISSKNARRRKPRSNRLMDNKLVVGVGNIYASESLFSAGIHPDRLASSLSREECEQLVKVIKLVLLRSIEQGGTTLKDFLQSDGKPGYFAGSYRSMAARANPAGSAARRSSGPNMPSGRPFIAVSARSRSQEQECLSAVSGPAGAHLVGRGRL